MLAVAGCRYSWLVAAGCCLSGSWLFLLHLAVCRDECNLPQDLTANLPACQLLLDDLAFMARYKKQRNGEGVSVTIAQD